MQLVATSSTPPPCLLVEGWSYLLLCVLHERQGAGLLLLSRCAGVRL
jgi:hypothetical protein